MTTNPERELWLENEKLKEHFDLWVENFVISDGVGHRPDWYSLANSMKYDIACEMANN